MVVAEGVRSPLRDAMTADAHKYILRRDDCVFRTLIPMSKMEELPGYRAIIQDNFLCTVSGPGKHMIAYPPIRQGQLFNMGWCDHYADAEIDGWDRQSDPSELKARYKGWDERLLDIIDHAHDISKWKVAEISELPTWRSANGAVCLMGDTCHAMTPFAAQVRHPINCYGRASCLTRK